MSQVWAQTAAAYYGLRVETFSGGTEATAFNPRAVAALKRAGFEIAEPGAQNNPHYEVQFLASGEPVTCFSKVYSDPPNPARDFCAVMVCSDADKNCPSVAGAALRVPLHFEDPKSADNTPAEAARYDERCAQIAREMLFVFSRVDRLS
jgi:arsenate reductase